MKNKILIISSANDITSDYLISIYKHIEFIRLNVDQFSEYEFLISENGVKIKSANWEYDLSDIDAIYYRKPSLPNLSGILENQYHSFAHKEIFSVIEGIVESFNGKCVSKPSILRKANNKVVQCLLANKIGFNMPPSRISNSPKWAHSKNGEKSIVKPLAIGTINKTDSQIAVQTNIVDEQLPMDTLRHCPAYFQDYIEKDYDLRITIVGERAFPVKINSADKVDWRKKDNTINYEVTDVPISIISRCKEMLSELELRFGCFDFVVKSNKYYFLEVNANGQWAWLEKELSLDISGAIIEELSCI